MAKNKNMTNNRTNKKINNIAVFGATSAIAFETCKIFAKEGKSFTLIARNNEKLEFVKNDLLTRGAEKIETYVEDLSIIKNHTNLLPKIDADLIFIAYGILPKQEECNEDFDIELKNFQVNFLSVCSILNHFAKYFENKKSGTIAVITSVAGNRGRQSNYSYGTAKGALSIYLGGLRHRLYKSNVNVIDIKPGFVDTPMTKDIKKNFLFAKPEKIAEGIYNNLNTNNEIYCPYFWKIILFMIKIIPLKIFNKLKI